MTDATGTQVRQVTCYLVRAVVKGYHGKNGPCGICGQPAWMHPKQMGLACDVENRVENPR